MTAPQRDLVLILDFGAQYTQLIARRIREAGVYCEIHPYNLPLAALRTLEPRAIVLSGGPVATPAHSTADPAPRTRRTLFGLPLAEHKDGRVSDYFGFEQ